MDEFCALCADEASVRAWFELAKQHAKNNMNRGIQSVEVDIVEDLSRARIVHKALHCEVATEYTIQKCEIFKA